MAGREGLRLSLAGAQMKLPVVLDSDGPADAIRMALPLDGTPSTHIIKPEPPRFPGLAANEAWCMALARNIGLRAAEARSVTIGNTPCLLVKRDDRQASASGEVLRVHQEDFCQALGFPPSRKYQQEGGPSLRDCFALLREWSSAPVLDIRYFPSRRRDYPRPRRADAAPHGPPKVTTICTTPRREALTVSHPLRSCSDFEKSPSAPPRAPAAS